jgi:uncharacterized repeat protein (TIGR03803 family)
MKVSELSRYALCVSIAAALLAACGESQPPIGAPGAMSQGTAIAAHDSSANYEVVYSFSGYPNDGANPYAGLIDVGGTLYGTTAAGGSYSGGKQYCLIRSYEGCGTVFSVTPGGTEKVLHSFGEAGDGANPLWAGLVDVSGTLYGTTNAGGSYACYGSNYTECGTVFSVTLSGTEKVLHSFSGYPNDGARPHAGLTGVRGTLYGTTLYGGWGSDSCNYSGAACGTVFSITTAGTEKGLHAFTGDPDGAFPGAGLVDVAGRLYGTTASGGKRRDGTVFSITKSAAEKVLHSFGTRSDGRAPVAGLIELRGKLYGTTSNGGTNSSCYLGCGTVFSITPSGTEKVLHSFGSGTDGINPQSSLIELKGKLYGTTLLGGAHNDGTVFSITPGGEEKVLHSFSGYPSDGARPQAALTDVKGALYGTTAGGGAHGYGTVFSLKP